MMLTVMPTLSCPNVTRAVAGLTEPEHIAVWGRCPAAGAVARVMCATLVSQKELATVPLRGGPPMSATAAPRSLSNGEVRLLGAEEQAGHK